MLRGLRNRPDLVATALRRSPLRVRLVLHGDRHSECFVVFTGNGHHAVLGAEAMGADGFTPDLVLQGPARSVLAALLRMVDTDDALRSGVLIPMVPPERFTALLDLVDHELVAVAAGHSKS